MKYNEIRKICKDSGLGLTENAIQLKLDGGNLLQVLKINGAYDITMWDKNFHLIFALYDLTKEELLSYFKGDRK